MQRCEFVFRQLGLAGLFCALSWGAEPTTSQRPSIIPGASAGDTPGEDQPPPTGYAIPPAPALTPAEALKTFRLPPGYRIEVVASEPLVDTPVALDFDPDGRIWVVEMRGYQTNPEGSKRLEPIGRIVVLEDTDLDGKMDRRTIYMDGLVLPRAVRVLSDGVLVAEPPYVWHTRDTNGDTRMDEKSVVVDDYGVRESNPGHAANGLLWGMDNWLHSATYAARLRRVDGKWSKEPVPVLGHWGMGMDDFGRTYMNSNSPPLRANFISTHYALRNPNHEGSGGVYEPITGKSEVEVFPIRPNPGANRGYVKGTLRSDGRLSKYTAGCGISIFRGDRLPDEIRGNHFFCEPAGNLVRRTVLAEKEDGTINGTNAHPGAEFLASTDERFRPVNTYTAPDGTLYIVDMYRGVLESHPFVTTFLKRQIYERGLHEPLNRGRIYRVVHNSMKPGPAPRLSKASAPELVALLSHENGWWRDTAQRLLVERKEIAAAPELRRLAAGNSGEIPRLHALWTLEGLGGLTSADVLVALGDDNPRIRSSAVRLAEPWLRSNDTPRITHLVVEAAHDPAPTVRLQAAASLGEMRGARSDAALVELLARHGSQPFLVSAVIASAGGRELKVLQALNGTAGWSEDRPNAHAAVSGLAAAIFSASKASVIEELLGWAAQATVPAWQKLAVMRSVAKPLLLPRKVELPTALLSASQEDVRLAANNLVRNLQSEHESSRRPLTKAEQDMYTRGTKNYGVYCAQCHQANGRGLPELAPSLVGSKWVLGAPLSLARIVLHGKQDKGVLMPPWGNVLDNDHVASLLTYIRRSWGNQAAAVLPEAIRRARSESGAGQGPWTEETLLRAAAATAQHP